MALTKLTSNTNLNDATTFKTAPISPGAGRLVVAIVANVSLQGTPAPQPVLTGNGLAFEPIESVTMTNATQRLSCFIGRGGAPTTGPVTITFTAQQDLCTWSIFEIDAVAGTALSAVATHRTGSGSNAASYSLAPAMPVTANEITVGGVFVYAPYQASRVVNSGPGCSQIDQQAASPAYGIAATLHTEQRTTPGALEWTWNGNANAVAIVLVVKEPPPEPPPGGSTPAAQTVEGLIRAFEPILFFDKDEKSFPSDAKRFVEHSALWQVSPPYDDSKSWSKRIPAGSLAAGKGEPGTYLGDEAAAAGVDPGELFLELGGWLDKAGTAQPTVNPNAAFPYADRGSIQSAYSTDPALRDSQFWYHAELFDTHRLQSLAETVSTPNMYAVVSHLRNPALLCYYLFFPEQAQPVAGPNIEAREAGSHAGQWACVALLLERDHPTDDYKTPTYIGFTGAPTVPPTAQKIDDEYRLAMKVAPWRPPGAQPLPVLTAGHPHLRVSVGTHSLYLSDTDHEVAPFPPDKQPTNHGEGDAPYGPEGHLPNTFVIFLKILPLAIPLITEALFDWGDEYWAKFTADYPADTVPPDASPKGGTTVHPAALAPPAEWSNPTPWRAVQNLSANGRHYNFIVDRATQPWWPSDDGRSGFRGRWGQRVETDPYTRRCGVHFPQFWLLFLYAMEAYKQQP